MNLSPSAKGVPDPAACDASSTLGCPTGTFEYSFATQCFTWSDQMYSLHGYERGDIVPTLELGIAHIDPADRERVCELWDQLLLEKGPLANYHTIIDTRSRRHQVLSVADTVTDDAHVIGIRGFMTDLTASIHEDSHRRANEAVARSAQHRAVIEQAKGILMAVQMLTPDHAFHALSRHSQRTNRKLTDIAQNLVAATNHPTTLADMARTICAENLI